MMGPSGPDTWNGAAVTINADGSQCVSGTAEGFGATSVSTSSGMSSEGSCGPCMVPNAGISTKVHCNRDYTFGAGYQSFFTEYAGRELTLIQDTHDPNDIKWTRTGVVDQETGHSSTQFATVTIPAGAEATFHCFVPIGCQEDHAHTKNEYPNYVDPLGGWTESSESYMEDNGIDYVHTICIDNALVLGLDPAFMGFVVSQNAEVGSLVVPKRDWEEKIGMLVQKDGKFAVAEYSDVSSPIRNSNARSAAG